MGLTKGPRRIREMSMSDNATLWTWVHHANIERYRRMMATPLTPTERHFIEQRIAEEEAELRSGRQVAEIPRPASHRVDREPGPAPRERNSL
jgi:hypothetical protein